MADLRQFGATLSKILPFLAGEKLQRDQIRQWLERNLQEISAREASQSRIQDQMTANAIKETLARSLSQYFETVPGGQYAMPGALKQTLPGFTSGIEELPGAAGELDAVTQNLTDIYNQFQTGQKIDPTALQAVIGRVKGDIPLDVVKGSVTSGLERGRQALTEKGYGLEERGLGIREQELEARKAEAAGGKKKAPEAAMKAAQDDIDALILKYGGVGQLFGLMPEQKRFVKSGIKANQKRMDEAAAALGIESPIKTPQEMFKVGITIISRYASDGVLPSWPQLLYQGYDPDFVFGLQEALEKPEKKTKVAPEENTKKALALLQALLEGKVE